MAWPDLRGDFGLPLDALGLVLAATLTGYVLSSLATGKLLARLGLGDLLAASTFLAGAGLAGFALAPGFPVLLAAGFLSGLGGGAVDSAVNTFAALRFRPRTLNLLHAFYSLGAFLGPLVMAAVLSHALSWRWGFGLVALVQGLLAVLFLATRKRFDAPGAGGPGTSARSGTEKPAGAPEDPGPAPVGRPAGYRETFARKGFLAGAAAFFCYTGMEFAVGQWAFTLFREGRGLEPARAALWVSLYWGGFTGGRLLFGLLPLGDRVKLLLVLGAAGLNAAALLIALGGTTWVTLAGLVLLGAAFAPVYPSLVALTAARLGPRYAGTAMGLQVALATLGQAAIPGLIGVLARRLGYEAIAWSFVAAGVAAGACLIALAGARPGTGATMSGNG